MNEKKRFFVLVTLFVLASLLINYFCLSGIFISFNLNLGIVFYFLLLILSFSYPLTVIFERYKPMFLTKVFYRIASVWIGIAFFSTIIFIIYEFAELIFEFDADVGSAVAISFIFIMSIISLINGKKLVINLIDVKIKGLKKDLKIIHLSDLHIGAIHGKPYLERVVKETNLLNPDLVVVTGDLFDGSSLIDKRVLSPINKIKSPVYFVIGNHEIYEGLDRIIPIINKTKMKLIRNTRSAFNDLNLIGIDYSESKKEAYEKLNKIDIKKNQTNILLYHAPIFKLKYLEKKGINLHLAGHTHYGQIFPLNLLVSFIYPYSRGLHTSGNSSVFVSVGTGTWGPPMRLGSFNEINLINLKKK